MAKFPLKAAVVVQAVAPAVKIPVVTAAEVKQVEAATKCTACGSAKRTEYNRVDVQECVGMYGGVGHTHIVRRYTRCTACGQARIDRAYENRGKR